MTTRAVEQHAPGRNQGGVQIDLRWLRILGVVATSLIFVVSVTAYTVSWKSGIESTQKSLNDRQKDVEEKLDWLIMQSTGGRDFLEKHRKQGPHQGE